MTSRPQAAGRGLTRESLLATAAQLFARKGYRATTLEDIAGELGLKKASLYHYIRSKDELLADIYQQIFDRIEAAVAPLAALDLPVDERLRRMVHAHIAVVTAELPSLSVAFSEESELPTELQRGIRHRKRAHEALFEKVIAEGQRQGVFRPGSVRLMVLALLGMCNWIYKWHRPDAADPGAVEEIAAEFALILESGIRPGERRSGAHPRFSNLDEAFEPADQSVKRVRAELERLEAELSETRERLRDGLAGGVGLRSIEGLADPAPRRERGRS
ncbi:TetR/AcrR family transcriptional regulator [Streptomyces colonosanans]|uniref:TetR/AcrR family transcriptional regulator n=1 Tax=Streptomyces colonosanans TaxID=1428652 RepID=UPI0009A0A6EE|nr:TetR/AcrR family transcriptional regulator [Streptomyces colonosanans]